jgi:hypothetical protein
LGEFHPVVLCQKAADEAIKSMGVLIDSPECLLFIFALDPAQTRSGRIDKDHVGGIRKAVLIVHNRVRRSGLMLGVGYRPRRGPNDPIWSHMVDEPGSHYRRTSRVV